MAPLLDIVSRSIEGVIEGGDHEQEPGKESYDLVGPDLLRRVILSLSEY